jgi:hypothetical protein
MQAGLEMGLKPMESLTGLTIINGQVTPWGKTVTKLLRKAGWEIKYIDEPNKCTTTVTKGEESYTETLTFDEAVKSKYTHANNALKVGWYEGVNRKLKLRYGTLSIILKTQIPEALDGVMDIAEIAEDFVIIEEPVKDPEAPKGADVIMTATPDERKAGLAEFLEKNKNNPKAQPKPAKNEKKEEKTSNSEQKDAKSEAIEGEIVGTSESKE